MVLKFNDNDGNIDNNKTCSNQHKYTKQLRRKAKFKGGLI
jgi:hypothetical protein